MKKKARKIKPPTSEFMVPVTNYNRKKLEKKYNISIPDDVDYIVPPTTLSDPLFWDIRMFENKLAPSHEALLEEIREVLYRDAGKDS